MNRYAFFILLGYAAYSTLPLQAAKKARGQIADERGAVQTNQLSADLARVSIVRYGDMTGTKNFGYMPDSLTEAIDKSLQVRFEYRREEPEKTEAAIHAFRKKNPELTADTAATFCRRNGTDILIFGDFSFDAMTNEIIVRTSISLGSASKFRALPERRNPVNATIFKLADLVADDIVRNLTDIAREQAPTKQAKGKKEEKIELRRAQVTAWAETNWHIAPGFSLLMPLNNSFAGNRLLQGLVSLSVERRVRGGWYIGLGANYMPLKVSSISINVAAAAGLLAYHLQLGTRWDLFLAAGAGYYAGTYSNSAVCTTACTSLNSADSFRIYNPYFTARTGANFLIFSFLSFGIFAHGGLLYDKPNPLYFAGGGATVGFHF